LIIFIFFCRSLNRKRMILKRNRKRNRMIGLNFLMNCHLISGFLTGLAEYNLVWIRIVDVTDVQECRREQVQDWIHAEFRVKNTDAVGFEGVLHSGLPVHV